MVVDAASGFITGSAALNFVDGVPEVGLKLELLVTRRELCVDVVDLLIVLLPIAGALHSSDFVSAAAVGRSPR